MHFIRTGSVTSVKEYQLSLTSLPGARLYEGMTGCENLYIDASSNRVYVTTLEGDIVLLDGPNSLELREIRRIKAGGYALGIDRSADGNLYAAICEGHSSKEWTKTGGHIARLSDDLDSLEPLSENYPSINGLAFDDKGRGYFATGNFNFMFPKGHIMRFSINPDGSFTGAEALTEKMGLANGLYFSKAQKKLYFTDTLETAGTVDTDSGKTTVIYRKAAFKEAFDDLCVDAAGRLWMSDPIRRTLKVYDPSGDTLIRYKIDGFGQASSCRIRIEQGEEILYITELVAENRDKKNPFNGRGLLRVPLKSFPHS